MNYDPTQYTFSVGECVWLARDHWREGGKPVVEAIIASIYDQPNREDPENGFIFYSVIPLDLTLLDKIHTRIRGVLLRINPSWNITLCWKYPGHNLLPGDNLFKTEEEAWDSMCNTTAQ